MGFMGGKLTKPGELVKGFDVSELECVAALNFWEETELKL
jgi:hypothetical protein